MANAAPRGIVRPSKDGALVRRRVSPGAKKSSLKGLHGEDAARLFVAAPPVDGKANAEAERFLAGFLEVRASDVSVVRGASSRDKPVRGGVADEVAARLGPFL